MSKSDISQLKNKYLNEYTICENSRGKGRNVINVMDRILNEILLSNIESRDKVYDSVKSQFEFMCSTMKIYYGGGVAPEMAHGVWYDLSNVIYDYIPDGELYHVIGDIIMNKI